MTKSEIQSGKVFQKKIYIYIYIYQRRKGTLYIKLSMLQENSQIGAFPMPMILSRITTYGKLLKALGPK